jgi:AcrR family transcriptional regulator
VVMKTRDKILHTALALFNERGVSRVSSRNISEELEISYGNLTYHFPKKEDIVMALYQQMQTKINEQFTLLEKEIFALHFVLDNLKAIFKVLYEYKFVFLGFAYLNREFEEIRQDTLTQFEYRRALLERMGLFLAQNGLLRPENAPNETKSKIHNLLHIMHFWILDAEVFYKGAEEHKVGYYLEMFYNAVRPSLTDIALKMFEEMYPIG